MLSGHSLLFVTSLRPHPQPKVYPRDVCHGLYLIRAASTFSKFTPSVTKYHRHVSKEVEKKRRITVPVELHLVFVPLEAVEAVVATVLVPENSLFSL